MCILVVVTRKGSAAAYKNVTCERDDFAIQVISASPPEYPRKDEHDNKVFQCGTSLATLSSIVSTRFRT